MRRRATTAARAAVVALACVSALGAAGCGGGEDAPTTRTGPAPGADVAWPRFGGDDDQSRFSPLDEIDARDVEKLGLAWWWNPGDALWESFPVVAGGTLYVTTNAGKVVAFDAASGVRRWSYTPRVDLLTATAEGQRPTNRGVAVAQGRVYLQTWDARLVALDADDGRELWSVPVAPGDRSVTGAGPPTVWRDRLIVGGSGSDPAGTRGFVAAFDAADGHELWRFATVPSGRGGGRVWMPPTVDARSGIVYAGTGNPSPALTGARRGCERWTSGLVALDARDGTLRWGATEVCGDLWDYDGGQPPLLYETRVDGRTTRVVGHANKSGSYWLRDAASGRRLAPPTALIAQQRPKPRPSRAGTTICPGALGGVAYGPAAHDPRGGTIFQGAARMCMVYRRGAHSAGDRPVVRVGGGEAYPLPGRPARGVLVALDDATGGVRWRRELPAPLAGGVLATAGGIVFSGCDDGFLYAFDADDGRTLWRGRVGLAFGSAPLTFRAAGRQYVAVVAGGSSIAEQTGAQVGAKLLVLRLGGRALAAK